MLTTHLPEAWKLIDYTTEPDTLDRPLVMIDVKTITPGPSQGILQAGVHVYVLLPTRDDARRNEQATDDAMVFVVNVLSRVQAVNNVTATRGDFLDRYPAWDIELTLYVPIVGDEEPEEAD